MSRVTARGWDGAAARDRVLSTARNLFMFLEERGASPVVEDRVDRTVLAYVGNEATFEVELDWREGAAFPLVSRTADGHRPPGCYVSKGERVRVHLIEALGKSGSLSPSTERELKDGMSGSGEDAISIQLQALATELRRNLDPLLERIDVMFS